MKRTSFVEQKVYDAYEPFSLLNRVVITVYELRVDSHPRPVNFNLIGSLRIADDMVVVEVLKILGDRVLAVFEDRLVVWDMASHRYYTLKMDRARQGGVCRTLRRRFMKFS